MYPSKNTVGTLTASLELHDDVLDSVSPDVLQVGCVEPKKGKRLAPAYLDKLNLDCIPRLLRTSKRRNENCVFEADPGGIAAEQYRLMQNRLAKFAPQGASALLTSPGAGDGKSLNAYNLAWALAEAGHETLLLELDLRRPTQSRYACATPVHSVVEVLSGEITPQTAVSRLGTLPVFYIGLDGPPDDPAQLLRSPALRELLTWAKANFTWTIIDGPPVLAIADVEEIMPNVDMVLMIARERVTPRALLTRAAERLGKRLNFIIFNDVHMSGEYGYGQGYGSAYGSSYRK